MPGARAVLTGSSLFIYAAQKDCIASRHPNKTSYSTKMLRTWLDNGLQDKGHAPMVATVIEAYVDIGESTSSSASSCCSSSTTDSENDSAIAKNHHYCVTDDGWTLHIVHAYSEWASEEFGGREHPVILCPGLASGGIATFDLHPHVSVVNYLAARGWDVWTVDLRGTQSQQSQHHNITTLRNHASVFMPSMMLHACIFHGRV